jgi:fermentation-respiration switch protein FrsA (DUF1100 family)
LRVVLTFLGAAIALYAALAGSLYLFQRKLLYVPDVSRPDKTEPGIPALQELALTTQDGLRLLAWYVPPPAGRPVIVYFHGNAGHLGSRKNRLAIFHEAGFGALFLEYRGYGGNPGSPTETGLFTDARTAMAFLAAQPIAPARIVVFGESLGTAVAVRMASEHAIAALVLESPFTSIADVAQRHYPYVPAKWLLKDRFETAAHIGAVRAPILMMLGERDGVVPPVFTRRLYAVAPEPKQLWTTPDGGHSDLRDHGSFDAVLAFIRKHTS